MNLTAKNFNYSVKLGRTLSAVICALLCANPAYSANVVQRGASVRTAPRQNTTASRMPTMMAASNQAATTTGTTTTTTEPAPAPAAEPVVEDVIIEDKSAQFDTILDTSTTTGTDTAANALADSIRRQRAALDAQSAITASNSAAAAASAGGENACDTGLRKCMREKCGNDFSKCRGDEDTMWGTKMDACRRDLPCTGEEYRLFAAEIKADRDMNARLASFNAILDCGNRYNDCIVTQCGDNFSKCLGKAAGDAAIAKCETIAKNCTQQDSGLANRSMSVFATLRQDAEKLVQRDEQRLYKLRDDMRTQCRMLGAMFDERSLDCVYTVNFFAANSTTPYASKKAYAGGAFDCTQNWFGIDITTFKENAYRETREQQSATSAMMGSGLGMAAGAISSGAINRAIDRTKAERALNKAEKEHEENYGGDKKSDDASKPESDGGNASPVTESQNQSGPLPAGLSDARRQQTNDAVAAAKTGTLPNNLHDMQAAIKPSVGFDTSLTAPTVKAPSFGGTSSDGSAASGTSATSGK